MPAPANLVHQTTTGTGTGNLTLAAVNGKQSFATAFGTGVTTNVFDYFVSNREAAEWERGTGHMSDATTLVRDTVIESSNSNAAVNFSSGTKDVTNDIPAGSQLQSSAIGVSIQAYDAGLSDIAALAVTDGNIIVGNGTNWVAESGATARASLGLGSLATESTINGANWSGADLALADGGTGASLTDPNADRIMFWDDSGGAVTWLTATTGLEISGTDLRMTSAQRTAEIVFVIDGGGSTITTGQKGYLPIDFACTITQATLVADASGSIVIDVWKDTYANFPPVDADSITASAPPTLSSAQKSQDSTLTGWTTSIAAGDVLGFNVDSITTCKRVTLTLRVTKT